MLMQVVHAIPMSTRELELVFKVASGEEAKALCVLGYPVWRMLAQDMQRRTRLTLIRFVFAMKVDPCLSMRWSWTWDEESKTFIRGILIQNGI